MTTVDKTLWCGGSEVRVLYQVQTARSRFFWADSGLNDAVAQSVLDMQETTPDKPLSRRKGGLLCRALAPRRVLMNTAMVVYCVALFLIFDFLWSSFTQGQEQGRAARIYNRVYDHGFAADFDGFDVWGEARYRLITDSFGFKDSSTREVPLKSASRRILLIGDSFTEGIGQPFENTFAGLLSKEGEKRPDKVAFLNAGVASYSPAIYYAKIKYLLDKGLQFDEVVLLSDSPDVEDEASSYFCIDEDPNYRKFCNTPQGSVPEPAIKRDFFIDHFVVTNRVRVTIKRWIQRKLGNRRASIDSDHNRIGWTTRNADPARYKPLGIDGGIARSLENMERLSDLLASRGIPLTIVVYPWAQQIAQEDRNSRQRQLWRDFCPHRCKAFIDLFPVFFAITDRDKNWYDHLYILGDDHFSADGNRLLFEELSKRLLP
jgi:lysophospholipase L1-like esterase